jgi:hypothetical protein
MTRCLRQQESNNVMKRIIAVAAVAVSLGAGAFVSGPWWAHRFGAAHASAHAATGFTCPMHGLPQRPSRQLPDLRHGNQGGCAGAATARRSRPHAAARRMQVSPERQRAIGIRLGVPRIAATWMRGRRARGAGREPDLSDRRRRERLDPRRGEHDGRPGNEGPGARVFAPDASSSARSRTHDGLEMLSWGAGRAPARLAKRRDGTMQAARRRAGSLGVSNSRLGGRQAPRARARSA